MAKRLPVSPSTFAYMERKLACVERRRSHTPTAADIARMLAEMQSPDEQTRAGAVRQVCPCHLPWESFPQLRTAANARHVEEDAREIAALEASHEWIAEHEEAGAEAVSWQARRGTSRHRCLSADTARSPI